MPVVLLQPSGTTIADLWNLGPGSDKVTAVKDPDDDATSYIKTPGAINNDQGFYYESLASKVAAAGVNSVNVDVRATGNGGATSDMKTWGYINGLSGVTWRSDANITAAWQDLDASAVARPGGGSWGTGDFDGAATGVNVKVNWFSGVSAIYVSTLTLDVDYVPVGGGFVFLLSEYFLPAIVGMGIYNLMPREMVQLFHKRNGWHVWPNRAEEFDAINSALACRPAYVGA